MSLLDQPVLTDAQRRVQSIKRGMPSLFNMMLSQWKMNFMTLWGAENPADVLAELGTDATEVFQRSAAMVALLEGQKAGCTTATLAKMKDCEYHEDGTVTIISEAP